MTDPLDGSAPSPGSADAVEASSARTVARVRFRWFLLACAVAAGAVLIDQGSKALALAQLSEDDRIPLLGDWLGLQLAFNPGTVMSLGSDSTWLLTVIATAASIALLIAAARTRSAGWAVAIGLVWGGAVGNLLDRLFAPPGFGRGHVTDFLAYGNLFIGNLADVILGVGVALGLLLYLRGPHHTRNEQ
ncbi:signal peptidase II [Microbacterium paraoxydans]|uniref:signal peptidase II n=1 Tax=Microbacterium paraoxydans TaxID=199592 RepID=UPI000686A139|nr:signal peptidase II [Microbacterium paraoxydans]QXE29480.1 signal peptidase II [Microbacterium paraoxydans]